MYTKFFDQTVYIYFYGFSDKAMHLCIPNLFSGAIEMDQVFGSSPMVCVKPSTVENGSNSSNELTSFDQLLVQDMCTIMAVFYLPG